MAKGEIEVALTFLPTDDGGRSGPARSGYRSQFYVGGSDFGAEHHYIGVDEVRPGESVRALLQFWAFDELEKKVAPGMAFLIREGTRIVAYGSVVSVGRTSAMRQGDA